MLIDKVDAKHVHFQFNLNFDLFKYQNLLAALEKIIQVKDLNIPNTFSSMWSEVSLSLTDEENDDKPFILPVQESPTIVETCIPEAAIDCKKHDKTNRNSIYGNRLTTIELMQLPWRSNVLAVHEVSELITSIQHALTKEDSRKSAIFAMIVALTSKPFECISNINIFSMTPEKASDDYIDLSSGAWVRKSIKMPSSYTQKEAQMVCLSKHTKWLYLSLPACLIDAIKAEIQSSEIDEDTTIGKLCCDEHCEETLLSIFLKPFWKNNLLIHRCITPASLRALMFNKLTHKHDAAYSALLLANTEYINPTSLYYLSAEAKKLASDYHTALGELGINTSLSQSNTDAMVGSELVLNISHINTIITKKWADLSQLLKLDSAKLSFDELIARHNFFSCYITTMLLTATGHRDRTEFGFSSYVWNEDSGDILLRDKVNFEDSAVRLLPLSNIVIEQLTAYKNCCKDTAKRINKFNNELANQIATAAEFPTSQWPIISHLSKTSMKAVSSSDISKFLGSAFNAPINCFRHLLSQHISDGEEYNFSNSLKVDESLNPALLTKNEWATLLPD